MGRIQEILYGIIVGHFVTNVVGKLCHTSTSRRYAIVADHCNFNDFFVLVGHCGTAAQARTASDAVEESMFYTCLIYDMLDADDRDGFNTLNFHRYDSLPFDEKKDLANARELCGEDSV